MLPPERLLLLAGLALVLAGCATSALQLAPPAPDVPWTPATRSNGEIITGQPAKASAPRSNGYVLPANPNAAIGEPVAPRFDDSHDYTLPELIDVAESHNPATRAAWESARNAALAAGIAKSAYLPRLTATVVGAYQPGNTDFSVDGTEVHNSSLRGSISALSAQWLLFDFGERDGAVGAAEQASIIANIAFTATHQQLIYQVSLAYYAHVAALARVATAEKALKNAQAIEAAAEARRSQGVGTVVEVAQARQATAQEELDNVQARGQAQSTYTSLIAAIGLYPLTHLRIADVIHRKLTAQLQEPIAQIVSNALARRPDVLSAYAAHEASLDKLKAAKAEFLPKIFLSATASYASSNFDVTALPGIDQQSPTINVGNNHWGGTLLLGVTVPLYDGGLRQALEGQARADEAQSDAALENVRDEAAREVVTAGNDLMTSLSALNASQAFASAAQITFDAALEAYRHGVGSITDATRAETALLEAQNTFTDAYSAALSSAATLALAAGTLGTSPE